MKPTAVEVSGKVEATENVANTKEDKEPAEQVEVQELKAAKAREEEVTAGKVEALEDEFCTDDVYNSEAKETKSVETQTIERGPLPNTQSKPGFDYYSLTYDDLPD